MNKAPQKGAGIACDWQPAVNWNERRVDVPDILLLHYTGMEDCQAALDWLCCKDSGVSCHYLVHEDGGVVQMVCETMRAWHAGAGTWQGIEDINSRSIGIEICNPGHEHGYADFPDRQIAAVIDLCGDILSRNPVPARNVLGHSDTAPGRKLDPGEKFPWQRLHEAGIGHWVAPTPPGGGRFLTAGDSGEPVEALQAMLALYGYGVEPTGAYDETTRKAVHAFQQHFRQEQVDGVADASTIDTLYRLIAALPGAGEISQR